MTHFWTEGAAEPVSLCADIVYITCRCFDGMLLMRIMTVASVIGGFSGMGIRRKIEEMKL